MRCLQIKRENLELFSKFFLKLSYIYNLPLWYVMFVYTLMIYSYLCISIQNWFPWCRICSQDGRCPWRLPTTIWPSEPCCLYWRNKQTTHQGNSHSLRSRSTWDSGLWIWAKWRRKCLYDFWASWRQPRYHCY